LHKVNKTMICLNIQLDNESHELVERYKTRACLVQYTTPDLSVSLFKDGRVICHSANFDQIIKFPEPVHRITAGAYVFALTKENKVLYCRRSGKYMSYVPHHLNTDLIHSGQDNFFIQGAKDNDKSRLYGGGLNHFGNLGVPTLLDGEIPVDEHYLGSITETVWRMRLVKSISTGQFHTAFMMDEQLYVTGNNEKGQLGLPLTYTKQIRQPVIATSSPAIPKLCNAYQAPFSKISQVVCSENATFVLDKDKRLFYAGEVAGSKHCQITFKEIPLPRTKKVEKLFVSYWGSVIVTFETGAVCWGFNQYTNLGYHHEFIMDAMPIHSLQDFEVENVLMNERVTIAQGKVKIGKQSLIGGLIRTVQMLKLSSTKLTDVTIRNLDESVIVNVDNEVEKEQQLKRGVKRPLEQDADQKKRFKQS
jgi:hypothetical protein